MRYQWQFVQRDDLFNEMSKAVREGWLLVTVIPTDYSHNVLRAGMPILESSRVTTFFLVFKQDS